MISTAERQRDAEACVKETAGRACICPNCAPDSLSVIGHEAAAAGDAILEATAEWAPEVLRDVEMLKDALRGMGWRNARILSPETRFDERYLRKLAQASDGEIITGDKGYRLTCEATPPEIMAAEARLMAQAKKMMDRARKVRVAMNRRTPDAVDEIPNSGRRDVFPDAPLRPI